MVENQLPNCHDQVARGLRAAVRVFSSLLRKTWVFASSCRFLAPATGVSRYHIVSEILDGLTVDHVFCDSLRFIVRSALSTARKHLLHTFCMYVLCFAFKWR
jgi:hypothetical protein